MPPHPITPTALIQRLDALGAKGAGCFDISRSRSAYEHRAAGAVDGLRARLPHSETTPGDVAGESPITPRSENSAGGECGPVASHVFAPHHAAASGCDPFFHGADNA